MSKLKQETISFLQTFGATFLTTFGVIIAEIPTDTWLNPETYKISFLSGVILSAVRTAFKLAWQKFLPVSVGGVK